MPAISSISTPLNSTLVLAAEVDWASSRASLETTTLRSSGPPSSGDERAEHLVARRPPGGVERADESAPGASCTVVIGRPGRERLVDVDDVEALVVEGPDRAQGGRRVGASGAIDPLAAVGRLLPRGVTNASGGGPSHGPRTRAS